MAVAKRPRGKCYAVFADGVREFKSEADMRKKLGADGLDHALAMFRGTRLMHVVEPLEKIVIKPFKGA